MNISRREFVKSVAASGIALSVSPLAIAAEPSFAERETLPGQQGWNPAATGMGRIDGVAKVTGAKLYASDFRAADLPGWPQKTSHALLILAPDATHVYTGLDLERLSGALKPSVVVTAADLARVGTRVPEFYAGDFFCPVGTTPLYLGQPVAMLIFEDFDTFDQARLALRDGTFVKFGEETGPIRAPDYGAYRFTRVAGPTPDAPDVFSTFKDGLAIPEHVQNTELPVWAPFAMPKAPLYAKAAAHGEKIRAELAASNPALLLLDREFETSSNDPVFLETECGIAWYDASRKNLELVLGVQSPFENAEAIVYMLGDARADFKPTRINAQFAYVGGGFGGRDHTPFPFYVALAGLFFPDRPVRLAYNRYQQFQIGIKRHAFKIHTRIGVDRASGKLVAFAADHILDGGGLANFSGTVALVGAQMAIGVYEIPRVDVTTVALHSRGVTAGSMRGYGVLETNTALETMVDEIAAALPLDPIEFRRRNALKAGGRTLAGNQYDVAIRTPEILDKLEKHPIWQQRADQKARAQAGTLVGTGVAYTLKNYGSGGDASLSTVEIGPDGRIAIHCDGAEMGNAIATAVANRAATHLGSVADEVAISQIDGFGPLGLVTSGDRYTMDQKTQDAAARNPRWVPTISSATFASIGAFIMTHAAAEAARIIFRFGLWPAALELWDIAPKDPRANDWKTARWKDGQLVMPGLTPLALPALAAKAHARNGVTGAMTHCFNRWAFAQATFAISGQAWTADIDALAVRRGGGKFARLDRSNMKYPPTDLNKSGPAHGATCGAVIRIEIERATGALRIAKAYTVLECGQALVPEVVLGQLHGGFAMGVGFALLESLPPYEGGPGDGTWNLGRYVVARGSDLPLNDTEFEVLPPIDPEERPKGMGEVVMMPVAPAILNAIYDATGHRFQSLPVTQAMIKGVLT
jgi:CO/xanthine dehydrogenase Mo-binding subunit